MLDPFDVELVDCDAKCKQRFLAEFKWAPEDDAKAKECFDLWNPKFWEVEPGIPRYPTMRANNTHGYYLNGRRTFWVIGCARDEDEIKQFCSDISQGHLPAAEYYRCFKIGEVDLPECKE